jgi:hypothetical protein
VGSVEFATGSSHRWPEAVVKVSQPENWPASTPPEAVLLPMLFSRLTGTPDSFDRYYGRHINAATVELLDLITASILEDQEAARKPTKGHGMTADVLRPRQWAEEQHAAEGLLMLIPERVSQIPGPVYARVAATLHSRSDKLGLKLTMPPHEPEKHKRRARPEKSLLLASAALVAIVEEVSATRDHPAVVVPTMEALRKRIKRWQETHDERGSPTR